MFICSKVSYLTSLQTSKAACDIPLPSSPCPQGQGDCTGVGRWHGQMVAEVTKATAQQRWTLRALYWERIHRVLGPVASPKASPDYVTGKGWSSRCICQTKVATPQSKWKRALGWDWPNSPLQQPPHPSWCPEPVGIGDVLHFALFLLGSAPALLTLKWPPRQWKEPQLELAHHPLPASPTVGQPNSLGLVQGADSVQNETYNVIKKT